MPYPCYLCYLPLAFSVCSLSDIMRFTLLSGGSKFMAFGPKKIVDFEEGLREKYLRMKTARPTQSL